MQSAFEIPDKTKMNQEQNSLVHIDDSFAKNIVQQNRMKPWYNEREVLIVGLLNFLRDPSLMNL